MQDLQKKLDSVITNVQTRLIKSGNLIPVKIQNGIQIGNIKIINREQFKDIYEKDILIFESIHLNKIAIKIANLAAISYNQYRIKIDELHQADRNFGNALADYLMFREKYQQSIQNSDAVRADIVMARMCYSRDKVEYYKKQALSLAL
jgi:hypothetical protein